MMSLAKTDMAKQGMQQWGDNMSTEKPHTTDIYAQNSVV